MASSSCEDDDGERKKLAEVAGITTKDIRQVLTVNTSTSQTSLRTANDDDQDVDCQLTPEFRKHVAKKLSSYIESCIQEENYCSAQTMENNKDSGIHLFHLSKERITDIEEHGATKIGKITQKYKNKKPCSSESDSSDDEDALAMLKEAAVSAQSIIECSLLGNTGYAKGDKINNSSETEEKPDGNNQNQKKKKTKKTKELEKGTEDGGHRKRKKHKKSSISS